MSLSPTWSLRPLPPSPSPPSVPPGFGNGNGLGAQPGESGGVWRLPHACVLSRLLSRPHEGWGTIEGCWEETPRIPAFWLGFCLSQTPNPPSSPFLSPQAQQHRRDTEQVGAEGPSGAQDGGFWVGFSPVPMSSSGFVGSMKPQKPGESYPGLVFLHGPPESECPHPLPPRSRIWAWVERGPSWGRGLEGGL